MAAAPTPDGPGRTHGLPLHPMSVSDVLDGAFSLYKRYAGTILTAAAALVVPVQLAVAFVGRGVLDAAGVVGSPGDPTAAGGSGTGTGASLLALGAQALVVAFVGAAMSRVVAAAYLGQVAAPRVVLGEVRRRWLAIAGAWVLVHVWEALGFVAAAAVFVPLAAGGLEALALAAAVVGVLGGIAWAVVWMALLTATTPALVVEGLGPVAAMRRSARLLRGRLWGVLGIGALAGLVSTIAGGVIGTIPQAVGLSLGPERGGWVLVGAGGALSSLVSTPFVAIVATLLYFDGRIRTEGFDLEVIAASLERPAR